MEIYLKRISWVDKPEKNEYPFNVAVIKNSIELILYRTLWLSENILK